MSPETSGSSREELAAALAASDAARTELTAGIRQPRWADTQYAVTIALTVGASGVTAASSGNLTAQIAGPAMFLAALVILRWMVNRFRALNGMWVNGYRPKAARGYAYGLAGVISGLSVGSALAGSGGRWWIVALCAAIGAAAGVIFSRAWVRAYVRSGGAA